MIWVLALWPIFKTFKYSWKQMQLCTTYLHNAVANTVSSHSKPWKKKKDTLAVNIQSLNSKHQNKKHQTVIRNTDLYIEKSSISSYKN